MHVARSIKNARGVPENRSQKCVHRNKCRSEVESSRRAKDRQDLVMELSEEHNAINRQVGWLRAKLLAANCYFRSVSSVLISGEILNLRRLPSAETRRPGPLEVKSPQMPGHVHHFSDEK